MFEENMDQNTMAIHQATLRSNFRALMAIAGKDFHTYLRYPLNAVSSIFQPVIWLTPVFFMGQAFSVNGQARGFAAYSGTADYMSFILVGAALSNFISSVFWGMGYSLKNDMDSGVLESNWMAPVARPMLLAGRTITSLGVTAVTSLLMLIICGALFGFRLSGSVVNALVTVLPMLIGLYGFGFAFAALVLIMRDANTMVDMGNFLVDLLSGSQFPVNALPRWLLPISLAIPLTYGYDAVRGWVLGTRTLLPLHLELVLLLVFMVAMIVLGLAAFNRLERRVRRKGTLGQH